MSLQKRAYLITGLFVGLSVLLSALILWANTAQDEVTSELETVYAIRGKVGDLRTVGFEFALYREERPRIQAEKMVRALHPLFDRLRASPEFQPDAPMAQWRNAFNRLGECEALLAVFAQKNLNPLQQERERQMTSLFLMRGAALAAGVEELTQPLLARTRQVDQLREFVVVASILILLGLPAVTIVLVRRAVLKPLAMLTGALHTVAAGDHAFRLRSSDESEFGQLARAFDGMLDRVQETTGRLVVARDAAESASRTKSAFLANMSHEIRTPMNAILGLAYLLEQTKLSPHQRDYVQKTRISAQSLLGLLNDILDLSKVEAGKLDMNIEPFRLDDLMKSLAVIAAANARDKDIEVLFDIRPGTPLSLVGDALRLQQVLTNLAGNAIKFTERGEVVLSVRATAVDDECADLLFSVRDTGIGIASEHREVIFDAFSQADVTTTRRFGGTGLGLAICRRLVELAGGRIWCESELGRGSTFHVAIRLGRSQDAAGEPMASPVVPRGLKVLIADDNPIAREIMAAMIGSFGWTVVVAASGAQALEEIDRAHGGVPFDLLLLDWVMPEIGGREIVRHLKARQPPETIPLILVVTAYEYDRVRRDSGDEPLIRAVLTKPVTPSSLLDAVGEIRSGPASGVAPVPVQVAPSAPLAGLTLLVVEDNSINQMVARRILEAAGAGVTIAVDGIKALEVLSAGPTRFDAVLMDIQMPGMDGYDATRAIRRDLGLTALPIIAMTANAMASDREQCLAAGMNDHIGKPFVVAQMTAAISRHARHYRREHPASAPALVAIDIKDAITRTIGDQKLLKLVMVEFMNSYGDAAGVLTELLAGGALYDIAKKAHDLKGVAANIGAKSLAAAAEALQKAAEDGDLRLTSAVCAEVADQLPMVLLEARRIADTQVDLRDYRTDC